MYEMMKDFCVLWSFSFSSAYVYNLLIMLYTVVQQIFWWATVGVGKTLSLQVLQVTGRCVSPVCPPLSMATVTHLELFVLPHACVVFWLGLANHLAKVLNNLLQHETL